MQPTRRSNLLRAWKRWQVSYYGGKYSIHRLLALETYTKKTSLLRVFLVCIGTPLPMAALIFIQESMPLRDPRDGWSANYGQWIRVTMLTFVITYSTTSQVGHFIDGITFSLRQLVFFFYLRIDPSQCVYDGHSSLRGIPDSVLCVDDDSGLQHPLYRFVSTRNGC